MIGNPRATQSNELYKMAADSLRSGRVQDSKKLLVDARELNPGDYRILITLGHVYVRTDSLTQAIECFTAASDYARTPRYKSDALLLVARAYRCLGRSDEAVKAAEEATRITPVNWEAHYELASYLVFRLGEPSKGEDEAH